MTNSIVGEWVKQRLDDAYWNKLNVLSVNDDFLMMLKNMVSSDIQLYERKYIMNKILSYCCKFEIVHVFEFYNKLMRELPPRFWESCDSKKCTNDVRCRCCPYYSIISNAIQRGRTKVLDWWYQQGYIIDVDLIFEFKNLQTLDWWYNLTMSRDNLPPQCPEPYNDVNNVIYDKQTFYWFRNHNFITKYDIEITDTMQDMLHDIFSEDDTVFFTDMHMETRYKDRLLTTVFSNNYCCKLASFICKYHDRFTVAKEMRRIIVNLLRCTNVWDLSVYTDTFYNYELLDGTTDDECCICLDKTDEPVMLTSCKHPYHKICFLEAHKQNKTCALCRQPMERKYRTMALVLKLRAIYGSRHVNMKKRCMML